MGSIEDMKIFWDKWEVQVYTLLGIIFQLGLVAFGSQRKRIAKSWIRAFVWICFLGAIWAADSATGNLGSNAVYIEGYASVKGLWPALFLILLGSPDTITAYAIEDNSLWLRLLLDFFFDVGGAIYAFILSWRNNTIAHLAVVMYIVGIIKYGERTYVRHKSSFKNFRDSLLSKPDPFPNFIKIKKQDIENILRTEGSENRDFKEEGSAEESRKSDTDRGEIMEESTNKVVEQERLTAELPKSDIEQGMSAENKVIEQEGLEEESATLVIEQEGLDEESATLVIEQEVLEEESATLVIEQEGLEEETATLVIERGQLEESDILFQAFFCFKRFAHLFAGLILDNDEGFLSIRIFEGKKPKDAYNLVAIELGIMYDVLYTKATIVYSWTGIVLRCISVIFSISVLLLFIITVDLDQYTPSKSDKFITYVLLFVNAIVEFLGVILLFDSDWATIIRLTNRTNPCVRFFGKLKSWATIIIRLTKFNNCTNPCVGCFGKHKKWSEAMGQFNLLSSCLKDVSASRIGFHKLYSIIDSLKMYQYRTWENVSVELLEIIFKQLKEKTKRLGENFVNIHLRREILAERGDYVLEVQRYNLLDDFREFILEVDFDHSLLLWHIATDICYSYDFGGLEGSSNVEGGAIVAEEASIAEGASNAEGALKNGKISKCLSDYMLYLLVIRPYMLPKGIGELRFADTFAIAKNVFKSIEGLKSKSKKQVCEMLLDVEHPVRRLAIEESVGEGSADKHLYSVLIEGIELAQKLKELDTKADWDLDKKWRMVSEVWVEMLAHAANNCEWIEHGYQLSSGGELLTHICLLMAHLGLSEQYRNRGRKIND